MKFDRLESIVNIINRGGSVTVADLAEELSVSRETIRKDLDSLAEQKKIGRVHGGAYSLEYDEKVPYTTRDKMLNPEKNQMANFTSSLIEDGSTVFFDSSSTSIRVLKKLIDDDKKITVITNSVECITLTIQSQTLTLYTAGGFLGRDSLSFSTEFIDDYNRYNADYAILSPSGIDIKCGITDKDPNESRVRETFMRRAKKTFLIMDHTKIGTIAPFAIGNLSQIDGIITDRINNPTLWNDIAEKYSIFFKETGA